MTLEQIPIVLGILVALIGVALIYDAVKPEGLNFRRERRRRVRAPVNASGELLVAGGCFCEGAALIGRDTWRWGTVMVIAGGVMLLAGALMNREHLKEMLLFRGAARRADPDEKGVNPNERPADKNRIR
jgi:drug/metabolite transporter (DMT)-like permease